MPQGQFYYLLLVCASFVVFGLAVATNYIQYRRWLKRQAPQR